MLDKSNIQHINVSKSTSSFFLKKGLEFWKIIYLHFGIFQNQLTKKRCFSIWDFLFSHYWVEVIIKKKTYTSLLDSFNYIKSNCELTVSNYIPWHLFLKVGSIFLLYPGYTGWLKKKLDYYRELNLGGSMAFNQKAPYKSINSA